jgi:hypothetical protein
MPVIHGRNAVLYLGATTATPVAESTSITAQTGADFADATAHGATFKKYVPGIADYQLSVDKFYDDAYFTMLDAAFGATVLKHYFYPDRANTGVYFYGTVYLSLDSLQVPVGDMATESWTIVPAGATTFRHP